MALEATKRNKSQFNLSTSLHKSSSFDLAANTFGNFEEDDEDGCWLPELAEPEEVQVCKSSQEVILPRGAQVEERGQKERSRSFDIQDLLSSPRPKLAKGAQPPSRLSITFGPGELSKALQALMSIRDKPDRDVDSSEGEDCVKKEKRKTKKAPRDRSQPRRSFLSLLRRRAASDKSTH